ESPPSSSCGLLSGSQDKSDQNTATATIRADCENTGDGNCLDSVSDTYVDSAFKSASFVSALDTDDENKCTKTQCSTTKHFPHDPGQWLIIDSDLIDRVVTEGYPNEQEFQARIKMFAPDAEGKLFPEAYLYCKLPNIRQKSLRNWLIYSESKRALFCRCC